LPPSRLPPSASIARLIRCDTERSAGGRNGHSGGAPSGDCAADSISLNAPSSCRFQNAGTWCDDDGVAVLLGELIGQLQGPPSTVASDQPNFRPIPRPSLGEIGAGIGEGARFTSPRREIRRMGPKQAHTIALRSLTTAGSRAHVRISPGFSRGARRSLPACWRCLGGSWRFRRADIDRWIEETEGEAGWR
jgi:hypothetical protein